MPRERGDNFEKSERELGRVGHDQIERFEKLHRASVPELQKIMMDFGYTLKTGRELYAFDDIGFGEWIHRHHLDTSKISKDQKERHACMQLADLRASGKLDLTGCNNTTPTDVMKWVRKHQRHLFPHLGAPGAKKKPAPKGMADLFEPDTDILGDLGVAAEKATISLREENAKLRAEIAKPDNINDLLVRTSSLMLEMPQPERVACFVQLIRMAEISEHDWNAAATSGDKDDDITEQPTVSDVTRSDVLREEIVAALTQGDWQPIDSGANARAAIGEMFIEVEQIIVNPPSLHRRRNNSGHRSPLPCANPSWVDKPNGCRAKRQYHAAQRPPELSRETRRCHQVL